MRLTLALAASLAVHSTCLAGVLFSSRLDGDALADAKAWLLEPRGTGAAFSIDTAGTIDAPRGSRSQAARLAWTNRNDATPVLTTPRLKLENPEGDLRYLTLGFDLWVSDLRPVRVTAVALDAAGLVAGTLSRVVYPPAAGCFFRFTPDLSSFVPGEGVFSATHPFVQLRFEPLQAPTVANTPTEIRVDNISYSSPSLYVSRKGSDEADGQTPGTAFASLARAVAAATPGTTILVGDGVYDSDDRQPLVIIDRAGTPDRWITLRPAPGATAVLRGTGWNVIKLDHNAAYVEVRGFVVEGHSREITHEDALNDGLTTERDGNRYLGDPRFNTNGISIDGREGTADGGKAHHIRIIENTVRHMSGAGISAIHADHITIEGNHSHHNCFRMRYASSGISFWQAWNFDQDPGYRIFILRNRSHSNRTYVPWAHTKKISDGNGIIIDDFINYQTFYGNSNGEPYSGRTLVQNNLVYGNGGSGMHAYAANHVDFVNNTAYHNAQSPELSWRQISAGSKCRDIRLFNNILWAQDGKPINLDTFGSAEILYGHNLMFGDGNNATNVGGGFDTGSGESQQARSIENQVADPWFVRPALDPEIADFTVLPLSPAVGRATPEHLPLVDLFGEVRDSTRAVAGAIELPPAR